MKIALVIDQYDASNNGTTVSARRFVENLRNQGHDVVVITTGKKDEAGKFVVPERKIPIVSKIAKKQGMVFGMPNDRVFRKAFKDVDIVHFMLPFKLEKRAIKIAKEMNIPMIAAFHLQPENITYNISLGNIGIVNNFLYWYFKRTFYKHFNDIHCPTNFIANELRKRKYKANFHVISNGVDSAFVPINVNKNPNFKDKFIILMIGRYAKEKRQDVLIEAVKKSKYKDRIQLIFAGHGPMEKTYKKLASDLPNKPIFGFYNKDDLVKIINSSDLYVHTADVEIEAISCIEAFSCGLVPIISNSKKSATKQFALDERSLFKRADASDLARKIDYFIENPYVIEELSEKYIKLGQQYNVKKSVEKIEIVYKNIISYHKNKKIKNNYELKIYKDYPFVPKSLRFRFLSTVCFCIVVPILLLFNRVNYGFKIKGRRELKQIKGGAITVANHIHNMDSTMVALSLFPRKPYFITIKENLEKPVIRYLVRGLGGVPIPDRLDCIRNFYEDIETALDKGKIIHFYPEASLVPYHKDIRPFKNGAFRLAVKKKVPIVPMVFTYKKPKGVMKLIKKKPYIHIQISKPIYPNTNDYNKLKIETYETMNDILSNKVSV